MIEKIERPKFITVKGVKYRDRGHYNTRSGRFIGLTVHYTVSGRTSKSATRIVEYLASEGFGCMVMDEDGLIYIPEDFNPLTDWGYHSGVSKWRGMTGVSDRFAGMEICCWGRNSRIGPFRESKGQANIVKGIYQKYTEAQERSLVNFILWALRENPGFEIANVVGHDELRAEAGKPGDKQDPGASLSMTMPEFRQMLFTLDQKFRGTK